jgi:hypothetical protein
MRAGFLNLIEALLNSTVSGWVMVGRTLRARHLPHSPASSTCEAVFFRINKALLFLVSVQSH